MADKLFDGARFGDRFLTKNGQVVIYQCKMDFGDSCGTSWSGRTVHNVMTDDRVYTVYDDGKSVVGGKKTEGYTIVSRVIDDEDFIDAIAIKECPFNDSCYSGFYKAAFKNGFKKALNIRVE